LPVEGYEGITLTFDDHVLETRRDDRRETWAGQIVPPGERLTAVVQETVGALRIVYRRAGRFGVLERRAIVMYGAD
jgi:hypothetical protein